MVPITTNAKQVVKDPSIRKKSTMYKAWLPQGKGPLKGSRHVCSIGLNNLGNERSRKVKPASVQETSSMRLQMDLPNKMFHGNDSMKRLVIV
eukprot:5329324-Amphidinium_carterae.1